MTYLFTSESVSEGHPDKVADAISDAVLDLVMAKQNSALRCACETLVTTDRVIVAGEYKDILHNEEIDSTVRRVIKEIGYEQKGFDWRTVEITNLMHGQSADIALGTDTFGAGDQGLMFGYAVANHETEWMPPAIFYSHQILKELTRLRKSGETWLGPDAKAQITVEFENPVTVKRFAKIVCSTQHSEDVDTATVRSRVKQIIESVVPSKYLDKNTEFLINPTGRFVIGGPDGDTGLTGRKIIVDTYGGAAPHGGGAFSGKDPTKVDRSAAYMARYIAKNIVAAGKAPFCMVQLSYAIGVADPLNVSVDAPNDRTGELEAWVRDNVDLTPLGIINRFDLFRPIYRETTNYGHFGKANLPWEQINLYGAQG
jgi:S-adenosylmethionine synthetase